MDQDQEHLRLLSVFHYVVAGLVALFSCFLIFHVAIGIAMVTGVFEDGPPRVFAWLFLVLPGTFMLLGWALAACLFLAGRYLAARKHYTFCLVMGAISCLFMPFGTVLGVFTIIVLMRPSVVELFATEAGVPSIP